jgi:hypothetical protein
MWNGSSHPNALVKNLQKSLAFLIRPSVVEVHEEGTRLVWTHDTSGDFVSKLTLVDTGVLSDGKVWASGSFTINTGRYHWYAQNFGADGRVTVWRNVNAQDFYERPYISYYSDRNRLDKRSVGRVVGVLPGGRLAVDYYTGKGLIDPEQIHSIDIGGELPVSKEEATGHSNQSYRAG